MNNLTVYRCGKKYINDQKSWMVDNKTHINRLYYICSGYVYCDNMRLDEGKLYLISDHEAHTFQLEENFEHIFFDFWISPTFNAFSVLEVDLQKDPSLLSLIIASGNLLDVYPNKEVAAILLRKILSVIDKRTPIYMQIDENISKVIDIIFNSNNKIYSIDELAQIAKSNKYYFIKSFKKATGMTPHKFINNIRMERALSLLKKEYPIKHVAEECGFSSVSSFSTSFKNSFGMNPSEANKIFK